jgi:hypothetical protein
MKKTNTKADKSAAITPQIRALLDRDDAIYMGVCLVQARGAWTRCGATWYVPALRIWITYGPGVSSWGTKQGLAQLATDAAACEPKWHAGGWTVAESPNLVFAVLPESLRSAIMDIPRASLGQLTGTLARWAEELTP